MALEPITRQEQIIAGKDLEPITRMEKFLKQYGGCGSGGGGGGGWFVVTVSADENQNIIADHYRDDIAAAFERGEMPIVKTIAEGETQILYLHKITADVAMFHYVALAGNPENADISVQQCNIEQGTVKVTFRTITAAT